jgi:hypothetical protein
LPSHLLKWNVSAKRWNKWWRNKCSGDFIVELRKAQFDDASFTVNRNSEDYVCLALVIL